ncbi:glycoside hydrolase family 19 protein [Flavobacterium sp.]|uniref:glycoside hydrolase family 19 protein n=1 Tax=Flavobacterium sp. TaxID=239 RepID=UPI00374D4D5E
MSFLFSNAGLFLNSMTKYGINTPLRIAHFLGQLAHESANFSADVEKITVKDAQRKYQNHKYLGNKLAGDGYKFRGRGLIQLTGRGNYQRYKDYSGVDIVSNPDLASRLDISIDIACWYWTRGSSWGNLNKFADKDSIKSVTIGVNGGTNGLEDRTIKTNYFKAQKITLELLKKKFRPVRRVKMESRKPNTGFWNNLFNYQNPKNKNPFT